MSVTKVKNYYVTKVKNYYIHTPTNNVELCKIVPAKFFLYSQLHNVNDIHELLPMSIILYQLAKTGHFVCVFENYEGLNFFDPLGFFPDDELNAASHHAIKQLHHDYTYLLKLLLTSDKPIIYNEYKLQSRGTATCGMWCVIRLLLKDMSNEQFYKLFKDKRNRDIVVAKIFEDLRVI